MFCFILILFVCFLSCLVSAEYCEYLIYWSIKFWEILCHIRTNSTFVLFLCVSSCIPTTFILIFSFSFLTVLGLSVHLPSIFTLCASKLEVTVTTFSSSQFFPSCVLNTVKLIRPIARFCLKYLLYSLHILVIISLLTMSIHFCIV